MNTNPFAQMLALEIFADEDKKELCKRNDPHSTYVPKAATLEKLTKDNPQLINFINHLNPFNYSLDYIHLGPRDVEKIIRKFFPLTPTMMNKLGKKGTEVVLKKWTEGINLNIKKHRDSILANTEESITDYALSHIFTEPIVKLTKEIYIKKDFKYTSHIFTDISLRAALLTNNLSFLSRHAIRQHFSNIVKSKVISLSSIRQYKTIKYKCLDMDVENAFKAQNIYDYKNFNDVISYISNYLRFISIPKEQIFAESERVFKSIVARLERDKELLEGMKALRASSEYKESSYAIQKDFDEKFRTTKDQYVALKNATEGALESISQLHEEQ